MESMTPEQRISYSHGRIKRDMDDFQRQIDRMHKDILRERYLWFVMVAISTALIVAVFYVAGASSFMDYALIVTVFVTFSVIRLVSYRAMKRQVAMLEGMQFLYSRLADDTTVKFVSESMKVDEDADRVKKMLDQRMSDEQILREQLILAGRIVDAIVAEVEKHKAVTGTREENGKSTDAK